MFQKEKVQTKLTLQASSKINLFERSKTIDWLSIISYNFNLLEKTLALAIECFDFYLERNCKTFDHNEYQFLGLSSLFMASKYEEIYPPNAKVSPFELV